MISENNIYKQLTSNTITNKADDYVKTQLDSVQLTPSIFVGSQTEVRCSVGFSENRIRR